MAIEYLAWQGYRVIWLRIGSGAGGVNPNPSWTAAIKAYCQAHGRLLVVVRLQPEDDDPQHFVCTVEQAVLGVFDLPIEPGPSEELDGYQADWIDLINRINDLGRPLVLAMEGYDLITKQNVHEMIAELLEYQPENLQVLLFCQEMPPLPLPRLRARRALLEIVI